MARIVTNKDVSNAAPVRPERQSRANIVPKGADQSNLKDAPGMAIAGSDNTRNLRVRNQERNSGAVEPDRTS
jgi:hypothetical protein